MGSLTISLTFVIPNTSNSSASSRTVQRKPMDIPTTSRRGHLHLTSPPCTSFFVSATTRTSPVSNQSGYHSVTCFTSECYSRLAQHVRSKNCKPSMRFYILLSKMPVLLSTSFPMKQRQSTASRKQSNLCEPPTKCDSSSYTCSRTSVSLRQPQSGQSSNNHCLKTSMSQTAVIGTSRSQAPFLKLLDVSESMVKSLRTMASPNPITLETRSLRKFRGGRHTFPSSSPLQCKH